jgi:hypothetical protein
MPRKHTPEEREAAFWAKITKSDGCWLWTAALTSGYGAWGNRRAHRLVYEALVGPIPQGLQLDHLCRNRACVRPEHLEPVTQQVNLARGNGLPARRARQTECIYGHPFDAANTLVTKFGRVCRTCNREKARLRRSAYAASGLTAHGKPRIRKPRTPAT